MGAGHMRNVIFAINITLDGCCDHTKGIADEETHEYFTHLLRDVDLLVFGRKTYQLMVPFWPDVARNQSETKAMNEFARVFDSINKIVFSQSLESAEGNTRIVRTKPQDEILRLKQAQGKNILIISFCRSSNNRRARHTVAGRSQPAEEIRIKAC
jgi:dihydrofolate reductase